MTLCRSCRRAPRAACLQPIPSGSWAMSTICWGRATQVLGTLSLTKRRACCCQLCFVACVVNASRSHVECCALACAGCRSGIGGFWVPCVDDIPEGLSTHQCAVTSNRTHSDLVNSRLPLRPQRYSRCAMDAGGSDLTSDVGWGCTLRSGQMLLAEVSCLSCHGVAATEIRSSGAQTFATPPALRAMHRRR